MLDGFRHISGALARDQQLMLLNEISEIATLAPLFIPRMPRTGNEFSVRMTNCGDLGWVSDKSGGYRYQSRHPETGKLWPAIPPSLNELWQRLTIDQPLPEVCLINYYGHTAKMGLHKDSDEPNRSTPVVSISIGDRARFRIGGRKRRDPTFTIDIVSGDIVILGGEAREAYHGIDRIYPGTSDLLPQGGRYNLTLRRVHPVGSNPGKA